ncbi:MAG: hypothetical protein ACREHD_09985 [Pirellulales bacterium]
MQRTQYVAALSAALILAGCGQSSSPPAPNPSAQPTTNSSTPEYTPPVPSEQETANPATEAETIGQESSLTSGKTHDELDGNAKENMPADEETVAPAKEPAETDGTASDDDTLSARPRSNRPARRLLRGLASSLTRALSKAASASGQSGDKKESDGGDKPPLAPKLEDDPFPNGEPADAKPLDKKPGDAKPDE